MAARRGELSPGAVRSRRYRRHLKGDHSMCLQDCSVEEVDDRSPVAGESADTVPEDVTRDVTPPPENSASHRLPPADLRDRGRELWEQMAGLKLGPTHVLLLERACRLADRLARLDVLLEGGDWLDSAIARGEAVNGVVEVRVTVDRALGETRQHEVALKLLVAELRHASRPVTGSVGLPAGREADDNDDEPAGTPAGNVTNISDIVNRPARPARG